MGDRDDIKAKIRRFIATEIARDRSEASLENDSLVESGIIDSVAIMKLVRFIEDEFQVAITDTELLPENFDTLEAIATLLATKAR
jgi:acyl carrier protein